MILWVNLIGQDTAGHGEKIVIKPRYQESRPNIIPSFTMNEGGQHRGTEKLLISISAQAGRPVQQTQLFCLPKSLASSTNFCVLLRTFSESAKAFRYRSCNHREDTSNQEVKPLSWHWKPLRNDLKGEGCAGLLHFHTNEKSFSYWLTKNCNSLRRPEVKARNILGTEWLNSAKHQVPGCCWEPPFSSRQLCEQLISHPVQDSQGDYLQNSGI